MSNLLVLRLLLFMQCYEATIFILLNMLQLSYRVFFNNQCIQVIFLMLCTDLGLFLDLFSRVLGFLS